jgi:alkyl sulfatase BDS1-like metallo-beta-lactamase superfamily hydrolase
MSAAKKAIEDEEYTWAAEILTNVIRIDNNDMEARNLKAEAYKGFAYGLYNINWRNWTLTAVAELEGEVDISKGFSFTSPDVIQSFPSNVMLPMITTRIDVEKSINTNLTLGITFTDENKSFALEIRRGVVQFHESLPDNLDVAITSTRTFMNKMLVGDDHITGEMSAAIAEGAPAGGVIMMSAIDSGEIKLDKGSKEDVQKFFSYFDSPVDVGKINLIVR